MTREKGIRELPNGRLRAYGRAQGTFFEHTFPAGTELGEVRTWRRQERVRIELDLRARHEPPPATTFAQDAKTYLDTVKAMPTWSERVKHIGEWTELFGDRPRATVTSADIRAQRDRWLTTGPRMEWKRVGGKHQWVKVYKPLSASAVNHRLRALENLWTVLDGRHAPNPVREVPEAAEPEADARAIPLPLMRAIIDTMPDTKTRARLEVIAWCGLPHKTIMRLRPEDVHLAQRALWVPGRKKGKGTRGRLLPLTTDGVRAVKHFVQHDGFGPFSPSSLYKSFQVACRKLGLEGLRPYDARHTFGTAALAATDPHTAQLLMGLSTPKLVERYGRAAVNPMLVEAARKLGRKLGARQKAK